MSETKFEIEIASIGAQGDGIAMHKGQKVFVPHTVTGDRVLVQTNGKSGETIKARLLEVLEPGANRQTPPCPYYGECGGCSLQHLTEQAEQDWKRNLVVDALARRGLEDVEVAPTRMIRRDSRRRTRWTAIRAGGQLLLGYQKKGTNQVIDIDHCAVLDPGLNAIIANVRALVGTLKIHKKGLGISATMTDTGIDLTIEAQGEPDMPLRMRLSEFAQANEIPRLSWGQKLPEVITMAKEPVIAFGGTNVVAPAGGFLQASATAEAVLTELVTAHVGTSKKVADLYSGVGTFALTLAAQGCQVSAYDGDERAIGALQHAVNRSAGRVNLHSEVRDLDRRPLQTKEFKKLDAVVLDPPRAGALTVCEELAMSSVSKIAYVSCNPGTFARDARELVDGDYELTRVTPVGQFAWSPHVELVAEFVRG
ncbi:MAG: class I SAM-dependent RNA methyltransferase [Alphaproteobacteria bacterium]|jgi:23S rRNA (uracil1939-C5)-methyltransferase|nr:class I SAM-dependent RNA methyltransferase [Alphaproteobacteria bacterium]MBT4086116.1 class I SAM-dependent RNA methyltransferase [Alphaproteobacteria bacterium]MBT4543733.1 class I SAM-dependent RNA methyltransferase [Alphaproteobacteria bacterium]MBT6386490.1 class I SAM-dependent RNA methyltransferase [Alphaproteobacteria bacterium]MBT7743978.1 class I SAM-dependent RNA methyltransferase [Alphaproteobacteria bacterium]